MRLFQAMAFLAVVAAAGCMTDDDRTMGKADGSDVSMPRGDDSMPTNDQEDMGMNGMGMPTHAHASCEASGGVCASQRACATAGAHMISAMCPASQSCCVSD